LVSCPDESKAEAEGGDGQPQFIKRSHDTWSRCGAISTRSETHQESSQMPNQFHVTSRHNGMRAVLVRNQPSYPPHPVYGVLSDEEDHHVLSVDPVAFGMEQLGRA
jgi:hypothetical protein